MVQPDSNWLRMEFTMRGWTYDAVSLAIERYGGQRVGRSTVHRAVQGKRIGASAYAAIIKAINATEDDAVIPEEAFE